MPTRRDNYTRMMKSGSGACPISVYVGLPLIGEISLIPMQNLKDFWLYALKQ